MVKAKLRIMGRILVAEPDTLEHELYPMALLIEFDSTEDIREAIKDGIVEFDFMESPE